MPESGKLLILVGSPRRAGNSATLARAVQQGAESAGAQVALRFIDDFISSFLRDCRSCRLPNEECSIADEFRAPFFDDFISVEATERLQHAARDGGINSRFPTFVAGFKEAAAKGYANEEVAALIKVFRTGDGNDRDPANRN